MWHLVIETLRNFVFFLGYFGNSGGFPKALSKAEEDALWQRYREGDSSARDQLIESNLRLVAYVAKKYTKEKQEMDDLISIGTIGLIKAVNSFNPDKNIRLATYAVRCIENEILMVIRAEKKLVNEVSIEEPIGKDSEGNEISLIDVLANDEESVFLEALKGIHQQKLYSAIEMCLTDREKEIIILRYGLSDGNAMPQREVAKKFGISRSYVSRIEKRALEKLLVELESE
ncbi:MAG: RNA polymerase sporulation sigma factor SigK [Clostridia bacterium]|nr:RNA polymerase sporulation sigma factor SigK [Clostridia bacterium]